MENGADVLLMAFAVLIFIIALSVTLTTLAQAKSTADIVLFYSDRENFQAPLAPDHVNTSDGGRNVGVDTVIATIVRCAKEKFSVKIIDGKNKEDVYIFEYDVQTEAQIKTLVDKFIQKHKGNTYRETYVEVTTSGTTISDEYGTQLEQNVGKKIYITYEKQA
jgi:uncharacterized protein YerC